MSSSNDVRFLEDQVKDTEYKLSALASKYDFLDQEKRFLVQELCERKEALYTKINVRLDTIGREVIEYCQKLGILHKVGGSIYDDIDTKYKNENALTFIKSLGLPYGKDESLNMSVEEKANKKIEEAFDIIQALPESRKKKFIDNIKDRANEEIEEQEPIKSEDFGVHQEEPPKDMQGPSEFSEAVRFTAGWFKAAYEHYNKIADEIETYKPQNEERIKQKADDWNTCVNGTLLKNILHPIFMTETKAESDRKYSTSIFHWIGIIKNRIEQSKHGAGKMAENYVTDAFGHVVYNKKGKPIKKSISRERVGDFEWPIVDMAELMIKGNMGMIQLHDWLENDQGGYRRYRKEFLHDYFAEASMGSIKSGNPEYEQFMRDYKKKQLEKFKTDANS